MERKQDILKKKYFKVHTVTDLKDLLYKSSEMYSNKTAFKLKNKNGEIYDVKYSKFKDDVEALGTCLLNLNLLGNKIALIGKNSYSWITSYFACSIIGTVVPIDKELHVDDVINFINISEASAIISDKKYIKAISENKDKLNKNIIFINMDSDSSTNDVLNFSNLINEGLEKVADGNTAFSQIQINPDDMHILLFTSGTTRKRKRNLSFS